MISIHDINNIEYANLYYYAEEDTFQMKFLRFNYHLKNILFPNNWPRVYWIYFIDCIVSHVIYYPTMGVTFLMLLEYFIFNRHYRYFSTAYFLETLLTSLSLFALIVFAFLDLKSMNTFFGTLDVHQLNTEMKMSVWYTDAPDSSSMGRMDSDFQDSASLLSEGLLYFNYSVYNLIIKITVFVILILLFYELYFSIDYWSIVSFRFTHNSLYDIIWITTPAIWLYSLTGPSFALLYSTDEIIESRFTFKHVDGGFKSFLLDCLVDGDPYYLFEMAFVNFFLTYALMFEIRRAKNIRAIVNYKNGKKRDPSLRPDPKIFRTPRTYKGVWEKFEWTWWEFAYTYCGLYLHLCNGYFLYACLRSGYYLEHW